MVVGRWGFSPSPRCRALRALKRSLRLDQLPQSFLLSFLAIARDRERLLQRIRIGIDRKSPLQVLQRFVDLAQAQVTGRAGALQADFPLTATPAGTAEMTIQVQGRTVDPSLWSYDGPRNAVVFDSTAVPKVGENIQIRYRSVCQSPPR